MKIKGQKLSFVATSKAFVPRHQGPDLVFEIRALPLGFADKLAEDLPEPKVPTITRGSGGKKTVEQDYQDRDYLDALDLCRKRKNVLIAHYSLGADRSLEFRSKSAGDRGAFADALIAEFAEDGLSDGDFAILLDQIDSISNSTMKQLEKARELFLSHTQGKPLADGVSQNVTG